jgi:hypothetical protein
MALAASGGRLPQLALQDALKLDEQAIADDMILDMPLPAKRRRAAASGKRPKKRARKAQLLDKYSSILFALCQFILVCVDLPNDSWTHRILPQMRSARAPLMCLSPAW